MKKIPPSGSSHYGSGFSPSSPGYSFGGVHDSHPPPGVPSYPDFKPIGGPLPAHYPHSHKPSYASFVKGLFSASTKHKPAHPTSHSHIYHGHGPPHSSYPGSPDLSSVELDYDPTLTGHHPPSSNYPEPHGFQGPDPNFGTSSSHHDTHSSYGPPPSGNVPPSTKYGYPIGAIEPHKSDNHGHVNSIPYHNAESVNQVADAYNNQPTGFAAQANQAQIPAQIHITPTTNFIEYTNIQNADSLQHQQPEQQQLQGHSQVQQHDAPSTSQQMAEEVIKYLGNLQQGAGNNGGNPHLFFGLNMPLNDAEGGGQAQEESFPLYPPGTNPQNADGQQIFAPTPLPNDNSAAYAPSGDGYNSGEPIPALYNHNLNPQYPVDSYGNPVQGSKYSPNNHQNYNNHNIHNRHVQNNKHHPSKSSHHSNTVSSSARHKTKPSEFDIVRSVSIELGTGGHNIHH